MSDHPDFLRSPEAVCKPDQRSEGFAVLTDDSFRTKQLKDQHGAVCGCVLHGGVPDEIRVHFETSKNLYLYSWFVYRFYPVAEHHAYTCLELALRERFEEEMMVLGEDKREHGPGLRKLLLHAVKTGTLRNENFEVWRLKTRLNAKTRTLHERLEELRSPEVDEIEYDDSKILIEDVDRDHDYLEILLETIPYLRNHYAHGSKSLHSHVLGTIQLVREIINQIFPQSESTRTAVDV